MGQAMTELGLQLPALMTTLAQIACTRIDTYKPHHLAQLLQVKCRGGGGRGGQGRARPGLWARLGMGPCMGV